MQRGVEYPNEEKTIKVNFNVTAYHYVTGALFPQVNLITYMLVEKVEEMLVITELLK